MRFWPIFPLFQMSSLVDFRSSADCPLYPDIFDLIGRHSPGVVAENDQIRPFSGRDGTFNRIFVLGIGGIKGEHANGLIHTDALLHFESF